MTHGFPHLARLLRSGGLNPNHHSDKGHLIEFKIAVQQKLSFVRKRTEMNSQIKSKYHWQEWSIYGCSSLLQETARPLFLDQLAQVIGGRSSRLRKSIWIHLKI